MAFAPFLLTIYGFRLATASRIGSLTTEVQRAGPRRGSGPLERVLGLLVTRVIHHCPVETCWRLPRRGDRKPSVYYLCLVWIRMEVWVWEVKPAIKPERCSIRESNEETEVAPAEFDSFESDLPNSRWWIAGIWWQHRSSDYTPRSRVVGRNAETQEVAHTRQRPNQIVEPHRTVDGAGTGIHPSGGSLGEHEYSEKD